ncbi:DUF4126 domain-containing protein [Sphingobium amiense]|uniref:DUF4126 domain-containing protein n=1 Tax=Sphingobium amiense TaxID=135719 RepID=A0A494W1B9_9SPHN|nr:DUF4126 family protein [Sphingobium amiense]BBD96988.1 DUF4126 domain-containing protein [Sphingobium amiense]
MIYLLATLIGIVAGLRAVLAPAIVSWAASRGAITLSGHWLAFLGYRWTPWLFSIASVGELVNDKLPATPSRLIPPQFGVRIVTGALSGAAVAAGAGNWIFGGVLGIVGAAIGTVGGAQARRVLAAAFGRDLPAALVEDVIAIVAGVAIVASVAGASS